MRIAEYKQIDTQRVDEIVTVDDYDADGKFIGQHSETVTKEIPVMGMVYRDATPEEIAEQERMEAEMPPAEPSPEERITALEGLTDDIVLFMADIIGG